MKLEKIPFKRAMVILVEHCMYAKENLLTNIKRPKKEKDSTLMGLTTLPGKPLMYCVIFKGVKCYSEIETGIGVAINSFGSSDNQQEFIENNLKRGKTPFEALTCKGNNFLDVQLVYLKTKYSLSYSMV